MTHQRRALRDIVPSAKKHKRLTAIMPCGTGKTMTQLWTAEALKPKTVLVLLPSLSLLRQTLHAWMAETKWKEPDILCVCSDQTVGRKSEDEITISPEDIGYPVTSDSDVVADFLARKANGVKLVFSTYHSSPLVAVGMTKNFSFDLGVFDEAHVTAGQEGGFFSFALKDANLRIKVRTFWTATPRHYDLSKAEDDSVAYSMDDTSVYGPIVHKLAFSEAVKQGIICDYEILVPVITNKMIGSEEIEGGAVLIKGERVPAKIVAHHMALNQAIKRYGVRKIFSFHPRVADAEEFTNGGPQSVARHIPKGFKVFHVNGGMTTAAREAKVGEFRDAKQALMSNARCLTQGIDVPAVDMVAFLSKKRSLIDIVQATGRAMRRAPGKTKGYILVPLYIEQDQGETLEEAVQRADLREVWAVLNAMREQDEALAESVSRIRTEKNGGTTRDIEKVTIFGPQLDIERLRACIVTRSVDRLAFTREIYTTWKEASNAAIGLGIKDVQEYRRHYKEDARLPSNPEYSYTPSVWKKNGGWRSFLGMRAVGWIGRYTKWQEASVAAQRLGIKTSKEYNRRYKEDQRLPSSPKEYYPVDWTEGGGWRGFLDTRAVEWAGFYPSWKEAAIAAQKLGIKNAAEYHSRYREDPRLPSQPYGYYRSDWKRNDGFRGFLGYSKYASWKEAATAARRIKCTSVNDYRARCKEDPRLPVTPNQRYPHEWKKNGGWPGFLGTQKKR